MRSASKEERREIGHKIKAARKQKGISQQELAELVNSKVGTISKYEQGYRVPDIKMLDKILHALDSDISDFITPGTIPTRTYENYTSTMQTCLNWLRDWVQIPVELRYYIDEEGDENLGTAVLIDGEWIDLTESYDDIMELSRSHFLLMAKKLGKNWERGEYEVRGDNYP